MEVISWDLTYVEKDGENFILEIDLEYEEKVDEEGYVYTPFLDHKIRTDKYMNFKEESIAWLREHWMKEEQIEDMQAKIKKDRVRVLFMGAN